MYGTLKDIKISGISSVVPENIFDNYEYSKTIDNRRIKKLIQISGIRKRHVFSANQSISSLATLAVRKLLTNLCWDINEIRVMVFVTQTPEIVTPSTSMIIQKKLDMGTDCIVFDVNLGCGGYLSGIQIVGGLLCSTGGKGILIVGDGKYREENKEVAESSLLFGDAITATAIEVASGDLIRFSQHTDGSRYEIMYSPKAGINYINGNDMLDFSMNEVCENIKEIKKFYGIDDNDIDYYIIHQTHKASLEGIAYECGISESKLLTSYEEFGNTSSASIPLSICNNIDILRTNDTVNLLICGYGIGLTWNVAFLKIDTKSILPILDSSVG